MRNSLLTHSDSESLRDGEVKQENGDGVVAYAYLHSTPRKLPSIDITNGEVDGRNERRLRS